MQIVQSTQPTTIITTSHHIPYLDTIRFVAMFMVIVCHACDPFNAAATYGSGATQSADMFLWGRIWGSFVRSCVPLFVMLTGILNLDLTMPMQKFWSRRISRVFWPFLIWSVLYNMFPWLLGVLGYDESVVYKFFVWASTSSQSLGTCLGRVYEIPYKFDYLASHMWYIYMLIGLYLYIPLFGVWVRNATRRQMELVMLLWGVSLFLPYIHEYVDVYVFGECDWSGFGTFYYFAGYSGYMLLGYYIERYVPRSITRALLIGIPSLIVGFVVTYIGFTHITSLPDATPQQIELFWYYCTPNVMLLTVGMFMLLREVPVSDRIAPALANFTKCGFGVYMIHYFFVGPTYYMVDALHLPICLRIPMAAIIIITLSWVVVALGKSSMKRSVWLFG